MRLNRQAATALAFIALAAPVWAQSEEDIMAQIESIHGNAEAFAITFGEFQDALLSDNGTDYIAEKAMYPLPVNANGESYELLNAQDLVDNFDTLLTQETLEALRSQDFDELIVTSEGVGFASGALWMANFCYNDGCSEMRWEILSISN